VPFLQLCNLLGGNDDLLSNRIQVVSDNLSELRIELVMPDIVVIRANRKMLINLLIVHWAHQFISLLL